MSTTPTSPVKTSPAKAVVAFVLALIGALLASVAGKGDELGNMSGVEWLVVVATAVVTAGAVYQVPNKPTS